MKINTLVYKELIPEEGYLLTDGEMITNYVCTPDKEELVNKWYEIEAPEDSDDSDDIEDIKKDID